MPYLKEIDKRFLDLDRKVAEPAVSPGELNYVITREVQKFLRTPGGTNYERFNAAIGALECAKLELYRRMVAPYEDIKIEENGDVYTL